MLTSWSKPFKTVIDQTENIFHALDIHLYCITYSHRRIRYTTRCHTLKTNQYSK